MTRSVRSFLPVPGDPAQLCRAFVDDPTRWLPDARHAGPELWTVTLRAGSWARNVELHLGAPWRVGGSHWRTISWDPVAGDGEPGPMDRLLPSLEGELGLHILDGITTLVLDGRYRPPGGPIGTALDGVALQRVARTTVERLLADLASRLSAESLLRPSEPVASAVPPTPTAAIPTPRPAPVGSPSPVVGPPAAGDLDAAS
jgi:hypothetical protein